MADRRRSRIVLRAGSWLLMLATGLLAWPSDGLGAPVARCRTAQLRVSVVFVEGAVSHRYWDMALRNVGHASCRLQGYPGVGLLDRSGRLIAVDVNRVPGLATPGVVVKRGQRGFFTFAYVVSGPCLPHFFSAYGLEVFPPNSRRRLLVDTHGRLDICAPAVGGHPQVYPLRPTMSLTP